MINVLERYGTPCHIMERKQVKDPLGGYKTAWVEGIDFIAAISTDASTEMQIAQAQGLKRIYTVVVERSLVFRQNDVFVREASKDHPEPTTFRATSNTEDMLTPDGARNPNAQFTAEEWAIPAE